MAIARQNQTSAGGPVRVDRAQHIDALNETSENCRGGFSSSVVRLVSEINHDHRELVIKSVIESERGGSCLLVGFALARNGSSAAKGIVTARC
jgi:hypothetical protein